jgi:hypothetical protein
LWLLVSNFKKGPILRNSAKHEYVQRYHNRNHDHNHTNSLVLGMLYCCSDALLLLCCCCSAALLLLCCCSWLLVAARGCSSGFGKLIAKRI